MTQNNRLHKMMIQEVVSQPSEGDYESPIQVPPSCEPQRENATQRGNEIDEVLRSLLNVAIRKQVAFRQRRGAEGRYDPSWLAPLA
jgi:hypothetical protein